MLSLTQEKNYAFFCENLHQYLKDPIMADKFAVICDEKLQGVYDSFESAYIAACSCFQLGDFIIQQIFDSSQVVEFVRTVVNE